MSSVAQTLRRRVTQAARLLPKPIRNRARPLAHRTGFVREVDPWWMTAPAPWAPADAAARAWCNICRWSGERFDGIEHVESAACPRCGSIARDRFLFWCFVRTSPHTPGARVLETSPRLGDGYRRFMRSWFDYRASDYDLSAHVGDIQLDLQDIELPTGSVDVVLTPHVLEHVPDTARALVELFRVIAPGGRLYLQVPLLHGATAVPAEPEFHADNTPVFFNFGWDLTDALRETGFDVEVLVTGRFRRWLDGSETAPVHAGGQFDLASLVEHASPGDLRSIADDADAARLGILPAHQFVTWLGHRP
jgi:SAM-dependent methyltransferase